MRPSIAAFWTTLGLAAMMPLLKAGLIGDLLVSAGTIIYTFRLFKEHPNFVATSFFIIFFYFGITISSYFIETGAFMIEIEERGSRENLIPLLSLFYLIGTEASLLGFKWINKINPTVANYPKKIEKFISIIFITTGIILSLFIFTLYSSPIILGVERHTYWTKIVPEHWSIVKIIVIQGFFFVLALGHLKQIKKFNFKALMLSWVFITFFILGEKFTAFIYYIAVLVFFWNPDKANLKIITLANTRKTIVLSILLIASLLAAYKAIGQNYNFIFTRIALQGQLLWSVMSDANLLDFKFSKCFIGCAQFKDGADLLSYTFLPRARYEAYSEAGVNLSGFFPALQIYYFGLAAALLTHFIFSIFIGCTQCYLTIAIKNSSYIIGFAVLKIYTALLFFWYAAKYEAITSYAFLMCILLIIISQAIRRIQK